ncbi:MULTISPECIES: hypothetical protein [unclassified Rhizobium]|uniref:hypothetical protein n=1 Tax=unclassified Rhizobium TaxID=2613769 RepID=UPI001A980835|nr:MULTISPECIES: hypothetical protein [unclassified Rhizobium]MBX5171132.1 hypothetical protein [Rhizobium sp. NZLR1b]MBX5200519.1 hypothetical protein [Rhizobium sp. NZLR1]QSZ24901.1 hypothetical protein J3O30_31560 [Rhizobium sp. NZLR1]
MTSAGINRSIASQDEVHQQLERILASREFRLPERARRFLEFVVMETLAGRREYLKAFTVAQAVFGRDAKFDAQQDPCVRIEAGRLRRELEHYYLTDGGADRVIITIPKGGYAPVFEVNPDAELIEMLPVEQPLRSAFSGDDGEQAKAAADEIGEVRRHVSRRHWLLVAGAVIVFAAAVGIFQQVGSPRSDHGAAQGADTRPSIIVERLDASSGGAPATDIARGMTDDIIEKMVRFNEIIVVTAMPRNNGVPSSQPLYALQGSVELEGNRLRSIVRLVRRADAAVIWASNYDVDTKVQGIPEAQASLAGDIATAVARPFGVMFESDTATIAGSADTFSCILSYYSYRSEMTVQALEVAKHCLQAAVEKAPADSNVAALLSLINLDEFRFSYQLHTKPTAATLGVAKALAQLAVRLDPKNARAHQALMLADFFGNDQAGALDAGAAAYASNPNDTEVVGEYGLRLSMSGEWDRGCGLISEAVGKNAGPRGYYEVGMALCAFMRGDLQAAELWSHMSDLNYNPMHRLVLLSILGALGKKQEAQEQLEWIKSKSPALISNVRPEVVTRLARTEDQERFLAGIEAAGLSMPNDKTPKE